MSEVIPMRAALPKSDILWAVIASQGKASVIAEVYPSAQAAEADRRWRSTQVASYAQFLLREQQMPPIYSIRRIRRAELPSRWRPLPALGILRGRFI